MKNLFPKKKKKKKNRAFQFLYNLRIYNATAKCNETLQQVSYIKMYYLKEKSMFGQLLLGQMCPTVQRGPST